MTRIPRLWRYTSVMVFSLSLLMSSVMFGMRALPHPGCVYVGDGLLDLLGGRYHVFPLRGGIGQQPIYSPDSQYAITLRAATENDDSLNLYLISEVTGQEIVLQEGLRRRNMLETGNRVRWSHDSHSVAVVWQSVDETVYLSIFGLDGQQRSTRIVYADGEIPDLEHIALLEWSPNDAYIATRLSYNNITKPTQYGLWKTADLQPI